VADIRSFIEGELSRLAGYAPPPTARDDLLPALDRLFQAALLE
jgi:hypothetical protein